MLKPFLKIWLFSALLLLLTVAGKAQSLTTVQDNAITLAAGIVPFTGKICFTSPDMVYGGVTYTANTQPSCVTVVAGSFPATQFVPNGLPGVTQAGESDFYTAIYRTNTDTFIKSEMWVVPPTTTSLSIYQVRKNTLAPTLGYILNVKGDDVGCCDVNGFATRIPIGADGTVKVADSTSSYGWSWKTVSGGGLSFTPLNPANNLSDVVNRVTALANLGAQSALGFTPLRPSNNLSDVVNSSSARANLGSEGTVNKDVPSGYAGLDGAGFLKTAEFPVLNANVGACGDSTHFPVPVFNSNGVATGCSTVAVSGSGSSVAAPNYSQTFTAVTSVNLTHNLGTKNVVLACFDSSGNNFEVGGWSVAQTSPFVVAVTFSQATTGYCNVAGGSAPHYVAAFTAQTTVTVSGSTHGLGTSNIGSQCYDTSTPANKVEPNAFSVDPSSFNVVINFSVAQSGKCVLM